MADYQINKEPLKNLTVTTTIRGITSLLSSLDEIKLLALRLNIPDDATVDIHAGKDGWSDSVTFTWTLKNHTIKPVKPHDKGKSDWFGPPLKKTNPPEYKQF